MANRKRLSDSFVDGDMQISGLSGTGSRMVVTDATGNLSAQTIPGTNLLSVFYVDGNNPNTGTGAITDPYKDIQSAINAVIGTGSRSAPQFTNVAISVAAYTYSSFTGNLYVNGLSWIFDEGAFIDFTGTGYLIDNETFTHDSIFTVSGMLRATISSGGFIKNKGDSTNDVYNRSMIVNCDDIRSSTGIVVNPSEKPLILLERTGGTGFKTSTLLLNITGIVASNLQNTIQCVERVGIRVTGIGDKPALLYGGITSGNGDTGGRLVYFANSVGNETTSYFSLKNLSLAGIKSDTLIYFSGKYKGYCGINDCIFNASNNNIGTNKVGRLIEFGNWTPLSTNSYTYITGNVMGDIETTYDDVIKFTGGNPSLSKLEINNNIFHATKYINSNVTITTTGTKANIQSGYFTITGSPKILDGNQAAGKILTSDANGVATWTSPATNGTVTSVGITPPAAGITVSGSPITTSGSFTLSLADDLAALEALTGTNTIYYRSAASTWTPVTIGSGLSFTSGTLTATGGGSGTVTSVGISSTDFDVTGSPITTSGTITIDVKTSAITNAKLRDSSGLSVIGRSTNTTGAVADITASSDYQVLRRSGTSIGFGSLNLASSNAVTGILPVANGGTGTSTLTGVHIGNGSSAVTAVAGTANQLLRRNAGNTDYEFFTPSYLTATPSLQDVTTVGNTTTTAVEAKRYKATGYETANTPDSAFLAERTISAGTGNARAFKDNTTFSRSTYSYNSYDSQPILSGGTFGHVTSFQARPTIQGATTSIEGFSSFFESNSNITNYIGLLHEPPNLTGGAVLTNSYAVYVADSFNATNNWSLYSVDTDTKLFSAGNVQIGSSTLINTKSLDKIVELTTGDNVGYIAKSNDAEAILASSDGTLITSGAPGVYVGSVATDDVNLITDDKSFFKITSAGTFLPQLVPSSTEMLVIEATGKINSQAIPGGSSLTATYIGFGSGSNTLTGSADLTFDGTTLKVSKTSGAPGIMTQRGSSIYGQFIIPTSNISYTGVTIKDMPVLFGYCDDGIAIASARPSGPYGNAIIVKGNVNDGIEFWAGLGMRLKLDNTGVVMPSLATWGGTKLLTVGYAGGVGSIDVPTLANGSYSPTITNISGTSSLSVSNALYTRNGDVVDVSIVGSFTTTGSTPSFSITVPMAKNFTNTYDVIGNGTMKRNGDLLSSSLYLEADTTNDVVVITCLTDLANTSIPNSGFGFVAHFKYKL